MPKRVVCLLVLGAAACGQIDALRYALLRTPPYDRYLDALHAAGIASTPLGAEWIRAGGRSVQSAGKLAIPHDTSASVQAAVPVALAYRLALRRGQIYHLAVQSDRGKQMNAFLDLFRTAENGGLDRVASAGPPSRGLRFEPDEDGEFIVRIQPELLADGMLHSAHFVRLALVFPVPGRTRAHIQSFFGSARAGGREHQGIDIFAPRGTAVVAAADGVISSTSPNTLGGNVVWLWDPKRSQTLYYAHLERHNVTTGERVRKGDIVGFVGNTGNARSTAPHLHFGIYRRGRGAIDPLLYVTER